MWDPGFTTHEVPHVARPELFHDQAIVAEDIDAIILSDGVAIMDQSRGDRDTQRLLVGRRDVESRRSG